MESLYFKADSRMLDKINKVISDDINIFTGRIVTGEYFIVQNGREEITAKYNPLCVDMETGGIAHVCFANSIPFIAIRTITDTQEESGAEVFEKNFEAAAEKSINILKKYLEAMAI